MSVEPKWERDVIAHGASVTQLCEMFGLDARDVKPKIAEVQPLTTRRGYPVYRIKDVAPYLAKKVFTEVELERMIQKMTLADLPAILRKEFWAGLRSRQLFEKENATLVKADDVSLMIAELFGELRMSLLLSRDLAERETEFTERQRYIYTEHIDRTLDAIQQAVSKRFGEVKAHAAAAAPAPEEEDEL